MMIHFSSLTIPSLSVYCNFLDIDICPPQVKMDQKIQYGGNLKKQYRVFQKKRCDRFLPISQPLKHPQKKFWAFSNSPFRGLLENVQKLKDWVKIGRDIHKSMKRKENLNVKIARIYEQSQTSQWSKRLVLMSLKGVLRS